MKVLLVLLMAISSPEVVYILPTPSTISRKWKTWYPV